MLRFYKREISPILPKSCRYVPTCSEYSMQAYKKYGVVKGTVLTAWRLCRCNPLGIHHFFFFPFLFIIKHLKPLGMAGLDLILRGGLMKEPPPEV
ncbi:hypothetical protein Patl1_31851 [Pistacia atlantica]|uniref:Uncharacterized protein n=1 Tax=Pistacia atlantica TaxID=434234 RepID=A0ACC1ARL4_9ROSI|nr:hypothetical protein Patl1_31851 [Pistacia atlantica]